MLSANMKINKVKSKCCGIKGFKRDDQSCIQKDDMQTVYDKLAKADMLVVASPVYFYGISSQLNPHCSH